MSHKNGTERSTRATIADVARVAGVSSITVSRVLTGAAAVRPEKVLRIQNAIRMLRYRPNEMARALRSRRSRILGLIVPRLSDPFFATIAHAVNNTAVQNDYSVLITTSNDDVHTEYSQVQMMVLRGVDGILIVPVSSYYSKLNREEFENINFVALDRPFTEPSIDSVCVQNLEGSRQAVEHLIKHGHSRIACISESDVLYTLRQRDEGYRCAMIEHDLRVHSVTQCTSDGAYELVRQMLKDKRPPTAIFTTNGPATRRIIRTLRSLGLRIPEQMALIGFDDFEFADMLQTSLTVVKQPAEEIGRIGALRMLEKFREGAGDLVARTTMLPVELQIRHSCGCATKAAMTPKRV